MVYIAMDISPENPEVAKSHWEVHKSSSHYICRERDASVCFYPKTNSESDLRDPPFSYRYTVENASLEQEEAHVGGRSAGAPAPKSKDAKGDASSSTDKKDTTGVSEREQLAMAAERRKVDRQLLGIVDEGISNNILKRIQSQTRQAPSKDSVQINATTVQVVKKHGGYRVVMDGVAQQEVGSKGVASYWLPRFRESTTTDLQRTVAPVVISLCTEDGEAPPLSCQVSVYQRVVDKGYVVMNESEVQRINVRANQASESTCDATLLAYPMISTPPPYFGVNDYSAMEDLESAMSFHQLGLLRQAFEYFKSVVGGNVTADKSRKFWASIVGVFQWAGLAAGLWYGYGQYAAALASVQGAATAVDAVIPGGFGAAALGYAKMLASSVALPSALTLYKTVSYYGSWMLDEDAFPRIVTLHRTKCVEDVTVHNITLAELSGIIYRISETRANGSIIDGTDETVGRSASDLEKAGWKREAALLKYLMYGDGMRKKTKDDRPNWMTGRYTTDQNLKHNDRISAKEAPPITRNTIDRTGLHLSTAVGTRTEFFLLIEIVDAGGRETTVRLDPTRLNGIDAAWISAGYYESIQECRKAAAYLEKSLGALPGVGWGLFNGGRIVGDTNNGTIVGNGFDIEGNSMYGKRPGQDKSGQPLNDEKEKEKLDKYEEESDSKAEALLKKRDQLKKTRDRMQTRIESLRKALYRVEKNPASSRYTTVKETLLENFYTFFKTNLKSVRKLSTEVDKASEEKARADRKRNIQRSRYRAAKELNVHVANIFDIDAVMKRINGCIIGDGLCADLTAAKMENSVKKREQRAAERSLFGRILENFESESSEERAHKHTQYCTSAMCDSLGISKYDMDDENEMLVRFIDMLSPFPRNDNPDLLRFSAFEVPLESKWRVQYVDQQVTRTLPQLVSMRGGLVSSFGKVSSYTPKSLDSRASLFDYSTSKSSVAEASSALGRVARLIDLNTMILGTQGLHFVQLYLTKSGWEDNASFLGPLFQPFRRAVDLTSTSCMPSNDTMTQMELATSAGARVMRVQLQQSAGNRNFGSSALLRDLKIEVSMASLIAVAIFSEVLAFEIVRRGQTDDSGFDLQKSELLSSCLQVTRRACDTVSRFVIERIVRRKESLSVILENDVCFEALPGLSHLRVFLKHVGALDGVQSYSYMHDVDPLRIEAVARGLIRLSGTRDLPASRFPFTCVQSCLSHLPITVSRSAGIDLQQNAVAVHLQQFALSFERLSAASRAVQNAGDLALVSAMLVDCVCSRPIVIKATHANKTLAKTYTASVSCKKKQLGWREAVPTLSAQAQSQRLLQLRINIDQAHMESLAVPEGSETGSTNVANSIHNDIVDRMKSLSVYGTNSVHKDQEGCVELFIPFGCVAEGSVTDVPHQAFEMHPVWVARLTDSLRAALADLSATAQADFELEARQNDRHGRPLHPHSVTVQRGSAVVYMQHMQGADRAARALSKFNKDAPPVHDAVETADLVARNQFYRAVSGVLANDYKNFMYGAERMLQVDLVMASGVHTKASSATIKQRPMDSLRGLALAAAVANAMSAVLSGRDAVIRAAVCDSFDTKQAERARQSAHQAIENMLSSCEILKTAGVRAVPFGEVCMMCTVIGSVE